VQGCGFRAGAPGTACLTPPLRGVACQIGGPFFPVSEMMSPGARHSIRAGGRGQGRRDFRFTIADWRLNGRRETIAFPIAGPALRSRAFILRSGAAAENGSLRSRSFRLNAGRKNWSVPVCFPPFFRRLSLPRQRAYGPGLVPRACWRCGSCPSPYGCGRPRSPDAHGSCPQTR